MINNDAWISEEIVLIDTWWNVNSGGCFKKRGVNMF